MRSLLTLSHAQATTIIQTIQAHLDAHKKGAAVAVVDEHGDLLAFLRTDGCRYASITIAINKAYTAAREHIPSAEMGKRSREEGFPMTNFGELRYVTWGGGLPIVAQGQVLGAVGVSGLPEAEDVQIAQLGIDALQLA
jgi:glc operon protein GlcG